MMEPVSNVSSTMRTQKKSASWLTYLIILLILGLIVFGVYSLVNKPAEDSNDDDNLVTDLEDDTQQDDEEEEEVEEEPVDDQTDSDDETIDLANFSTSQQMVGDEDNEAEYTLRTVSNSPESNDYHRFVFTLLSTETDEEPYVVATYKASLGAINIDLNGTTKDESGLGYQKSININKDGVIRLYHNVSSDQTEELYDIGVSESTPFYLYFRQTATNAQAQAAVWEVIVDVQYPGASDSESDFGSEEFSEDAQIIDGANKADGAKISSYSYNTSSGVLSIIFTVSGSSTKPIPSAAAGFDGSGDLVLRFTSVVSDAIAKSNPSVSLPGGISMSAEMEDSDTSMYVFDGVNGEFRLSGTTNPNQVMLEIKL